jgi:DNA-binding HxlR family transcriptional regulator
MSSRSYDHYCGLAFALDAVGERWALLVVRELLCGPRRFGDLHAGMPGVATNTLTSRLAELEEKGLVCRHTLPPPASTSVYALTERGRALEPAILELVKWATPEVAAAALPGRSKGPKRKLHPLRATWLALALKSFFVKSQARGSGLVVLDVPTGALTVRVKAGTLEVRDRQAGDVADARLACTEDAVIGLCVGGLTVPQLQQLPQVTVEGDAEVLERVLAAFRR